MVFVVVFCSYKLFCCFFFQVFFCVVLYGLFYGLCYFFVLFSVIGLLLYEFVLVYVLGLDYKDGCCFLVYLVGLLGDNVSYELVVVNGKKVFVKGDS